MVKTIKTMKTEEEAKQRAKNSMALKGALDVKKETLEEFINSQPYYGSCTTEYLEGIEEGAKWQAERMYSEEDMEKAFQNGLNRSFDSDFDRWFEQFKKKGGDK